MTRPAIAIVAAVARNGIIGAGGAMPWRLSSDLRRFKALTLGHPVVMGRHTFDSIGTPLPGRTSIVVSRDPGFAPPGGVMAAASLEDALALARERVRNDGRGTVFVIGGGQVYAEAMPAADILHITHVAAEPEGDTRFPAIDPAMWIPVREERVAAGDRDSAATVYVVYRRRDAASG